MTRHKSGVPPSSPFHSSLSLLAMQSDWTRHRIWSTKLDPGRAAKKGKERRRGEGRWRWREHKRNPLRKGSNELLGIVDTWRKEELCACGCSTEQGFSRGSQPFWIATHSKTSTTYEYEGPSLVSSRASTDPLMTSKASHDLSTVYTYR